MSIETIWIGIGFLGQGLFFGRWVVQWIASERTSESRVPISFWYMSLIGGLITLTYAIYRMDPVFIADNPLERWCISEIWSSFIERGTQRAPLGRKHE